MDDIFNTPITLEHLCSPFAFVVNTTILAFRKYEFMRVSLGDFRCPLTSMGIIFVPTNEVGTSGLGTNCGSLFRLFVTPQSQCDFVQPQYLSRELAICYSRSILSARIS